MERNPEKGVFTLTIKIIIGLIYITKNKNLFIKEKRTPVFICIEFTGIQFCEEYFFQHTKSQSAFGGYCSKRFHACFFKDIHFGLII